MITATAFKLSLNFRDNHKHTSDEAFIKAFNEVMTENSRINQQIT